ncbi:hypothetical protein [Nostoc sp.]
MGIRDWGLGIGDWGLGTGDWGLGIQTPTSGIIQRKIVLNFELLYIFVA